MAEDRRDDWNNSVDARLVNLTSAQKTADADLDELRVEQIRIDRILRGDPERNHEGLMEMINRLQTEVNKFNAILHPDHMGKGGLINDIRELMGNRTKRERREGYAWHFATSVLVQLIVLAGLVFVNWDRIRFMFHSSSFEPSVQLQKEINADKRRSRTRAARRKQASAPKAVPAVGKTDAGH